MEEEKPKMQIDINKLPRLCELNQRENQRFMRFLKNDCIPQERFNEIVEKVKASIDCTKCSNCCKLLKAILDENDIKRISESRNMPQEDFIKKYLRKNEDGELELSQNPCVFLSESKCSIYNIRPRACERFPNLDKDVNQRCFQFFSNAEVCPWVFNVLEDAKEEFLYGIRAE